MGELVSVGYGAQQLERFVLWDVSDWPRRIEMELRRTYNTILCSTYIDTYFKYLRYAHKPPHTRHILTVCVSQGCDSCTSLHFHHAMGPEDHMGGHARDGQVVPSRTALVHLCCSLSAPLPSVPGRRGAPFTRDDPVVLRPSIPVSTRGGPGDVLSLTHFLSSPFSKTSSYSPLQLWSAFAPSECEKDALPGLAFARMYKT
ncbi:hypothetical protein F4780DRAFT_58172 [Xylariomycetidae sp. FL0641]|nr:hypothetical protein F4780DRAFT_58172 [Xylariomycetidae sp. FL0641]